MDLIEFRSLKRENLMGESRKDTLRVSFNKKLKLEFHGTKVTSDAAFADPNVYRYLEAEGYFYAIRVSRQQK